MVTTTKKTENFINPQDNPSIMEESDNLGERVQLYMQYLQSSEFETAIKGFIARYAPNGRFARIGPSEDCLTFEEFDAYADSKVSRRKKERYDSHIVECEDCAEVSEKLQEYLAQRRSSNILARLFRQAIALPYRARDHISERLPEIKQRVQNVLVGYR